MWARMARDDIFDSGSGIEGQMAAGVLQFAAAQKVSKKRQRTKTNERTTRAVHRESCPWREGWRAVPPTLP